MWHDCRALQLVTFHAIMHHAVEHHPPPPPPRHSCLRPSLLSRACSVDYVCCYVDANAAWSASTMLITIWCFGIFWVTIIYTHLLQWTPTPLPLHPPLFIRSIRVPHQPTASNPSSCCSPPPAQGSPLPPPSIDSPALASPASPALPCADSPDPPHLSSPAQQQQQQHPLAAAAKPSTVQLQASQPVQLAAQHSTAQPSAATKLLHSAFCANLGPADLTDAFAKLAGPAAAADALPPRQEILMGCHPGRQPCKMMPEVWAGKRSESVNDASL